MMGMKFEKASECSVVGTCLQGYLDRTFDDLQAVFGDPYFCSGDKVDVEWVLRFDDGTIATIYNWKDYDGGWSCQTGMYRWHIGGKTYDAVLAVLGALK